MNRKLREIQDWVGLARATNYQVQALATQCDCSLRQLERHFAQCQCQPPEAWLLEVRLWEAARFLIEGQAPKEASLNAGFKEVCHFCHAFKQYHGCTPLEFLEIYHQRQLEREQQSPQASVGENRDVTAPIEIPVHEDALALLNSLPQWHRKRTSLVS